MKTKQKTSDHLMFSSELRFESDQYLIRWIRIASQLLAWEPSIVNDPKKRSPEEAIMFWIDELNHWKTMRFQFRRAPKLMFFIKSNDPEIGVTLWDVACAYKTDFAVQLTLHESECPVSQQSLFVIRTKFEECRRRSLGIAPEGPI